MMKSRLLTAVMFILLGAIGVQAQVVFDVKNEAGIPIRYKVLSETEKTVAVTGGRKFYSIVKDLIVPEIVNYNSAIYTVTEIGAGAFSTSNEGILGCKIERVMLPPTIKKIDWCAFQGCKRLSSINLPEGMEEIEGRAFFGTSSLTKIYIPSSVKKIGNDAFTCYWGLMADKELENLPYFVTTETCKRIGLSKESVETYLAYHPRTTQSQQQIVYVQSPVQQPESAQDQPKTPSSDVDLNIPQSASNNENTFAVIFANENYQEEEKVEYALNDGEIFREYCLKVLGLPEDNVHIRKDATLNNIRAEVEWMQQVAEAYNGQARFIVFYAGHGIPDEKSATAYLLPVDGKGTMLTTGYSLADLYATLGKMPAERVTVFMDACFSGSKRGDGMLASARGVAIKTKPQAPQGKMVVFSAAQGDETAYPLKDKEHGLFTYYLLKKLQETNGNVTYGELGKYLTEQVSRKSIVSNGKRQTPSIVSSSAITEAWQNMRLK